MPAQSNTNAKEIHSLLSAFSMIRILNHVAGAPITRAELHQAFPPKEAPSLDRTLARLRRHGWLTARNSTWSLTPAGRKALQLATSGLKDLAALTGRHV